MTDILYTVGNGLYVNLTNKCPCNCTFCIRQETNALGTAENLWLEKDLSFEDVKAAFDREDLSKYDELVFCGYGEPTCALDLMLETCKMVRARSDIKIRLNTNGLSDLIHKKPTAHLLEGLLDSVSISLNAPDAKKYNAVTRPSFGEPSFDAMLQFARDCKRYVPQVMMTVVDVIPAEDIEACKKLAASLDIPLRVRKYS